ncbi:hypothetical protein [Streptomyces sp. NPDC055912]|uniref:hypothetical protein n=1 Tax=Streptomyces sp. NPDC055912 TaxID=3345660 RepID=UPI0035E18C5C
MSEGTTLWAEDLGIHRHSDVYDVLTDREGDRGSPASILGVGEVWNYAGVTEGWLRHVRDQLASHGIRYDVDDDAVAVPASVSAREAALLCATVADGFPAWIDQLISEVRAGKPDPAQWDVRGDADSGALWIAMSQE